MPFFGSRGVREQDVSASAENGEAVPAQERSGFLSNIRRSSRRPSNRSIDKRKRNLYPSFGSRASRLSGRRTDLEEAAQDAEIPHDAVPQPQNRVGVTIVSPIVALPHDPERQLEHEQLEEGEQLPGVPLEFGTLTLWDEYGMKLTTMIWVIFTLLAIVFTVESTLWRLSPIRLVAYWFPPLLWSIQFFTLSPTRYANPNASCKVFPHGTCLLYAMTMFAILAGILVDLGLTLFAVDEIVSSTWSFWSAASGCVLINSLYASVMMILAIRLKLLAWAGTGTLVAPSERDIEANRAGPVKGKFDKWYDIQQENARNSRLQKLMERVAKKDTKKSLEALEKERQAIVDATAQAVREQVERDRRSNRRSNRISAETAALPVAVAATTAVGSFRNASGRFRRMSKQNQAIILTQLVEMYREGLFSKEEFEMAKASLLQLPAPKVKEEPKPEPAPAPAKDANAEAMIVLQKQLVTLNQELAQLKGGKEMEAFRREMELKAQIADLERKAENEKAMKERMDQFAAEYTRNQTELKDTVISTLHEIKRREREEYQEEEVYSTDDDESVDSDYSGQYAYISQVSAAMAEKKGKKGKKGKKRTTKKGHVDDRPPRFSFGMPDAELFEHLGDIGELLDPIEGDDIVGKNGSTSELITVPNLFPGFTSTFKTEFLPRYYRHANKNVQCFPMCEYFGRYSLRKAEGGEHIGSTCVGLVELTLDDLPLLDLDPEEDLRILGRIWDYNDNSGMEILMSGLMTKPKEDLSIDNIKDSQYIRGVPQVSGPNSLTCRFAQPKRWRHYQNGKCRFEVLVYMETSTFIRLARLRRSSRASSLGRLSVPTDIGTSTYVLFHIAESDPFTIYPTSKLTAKSKRRDEVDMERLSQLPIDVVSQDRSAGAKKKVRG